MKNQFLASAMLAAAILSGASAASALRIERMAATALAAPAASAQTIEVVSGQALAQFSVDMSSATQARALSAVGCRVISELPGGWTLVGLPPGMTVAAALPLLKGVSSVVNVAPDHVYRPTLSPNDPLVVDQYALTNIDAFRGWDIDTGNTNKVTIAMIDTGIDSTQPDLSAKLSNTVSQFFDPDNGGAQSADNPPTPACYHGTATAGVAAASTNNSIGIAGISWGAQLLSLKVFNPNDCNLSDCSDKSPNICGTDDAAMANAINYAITKESNSSYGKIVINMSLGGSGPCSSSPLTQTALQTAVAQGIPITISAGNDGGPVNSPANCAGTTPGSGIIPVGATDSNNNIASFSSNGPELAANGVVAPGVNVETTDLGNSYTGTASGTSFSAPHVAGLAALLLSARPTATAIQLQAWIREGGQNIGAGANYQGAGLIDNYVSLSTATTGGPPPATAVGEPQAFAYPNPFRMSQSSLVFFNIPQQLKNANPVIKIYTVTGQLVAELTAFSWNGRNSSGNPVASGTYIFEVSSSAGHALGRMAVIR
ncbi:MAG: S8 family serine peptidase [Elusimicrobiota bacterium]